MHGIICYRPKEHKSLNLGTQYAISYHYRLKNIMKQEACRRSEILGQFIIGNDHKIGEEHDFSCQKQAQSRRSNQP